MFDRSIWSRNPMFLMSWTRTRSSADRRRCGDSGFLSLMAPCPLLPAGAREIDLDGDSGSKHGLRGLSVHGDDDLEGSARRVHVGADELNGARGLRGGETVWHDVDPVPLPDFQEILLPDVDSREERLGRDDLEERLRSGFGDFLPQARVLLGHDAVGGRADDGVLPD